MEVRSILFTFPPESRGRDSTGQKARDPLRILPTILLKESMFIKSKTQEVTQEVTPLQKSEGKHFHGVSHGCGERPGGSL